MIFPEGFLLSATAFAFVAAPPATQTAPAGALGAEGQAEVRLGERVLVVVVVDVLVAEDGDRVRSVHGRVVEVAMLPGQGLVETVPGRAFSSARFDASTSLPQLTSGARRSSYRGN